MIKAYLDRIQHYAKHAESEANILSVSMPEGRHYQDLQYNLRQLFEACDVLRFNLQDERSDLAPPTREDKTFAVMSAMHFRERTTQFGDIILTGSLTMENSVQFRPEPKDLDRKDRMKHELADRVADSLSQDRLESLVKWHRERMATAAMQTDTSV
jgi:hypothetical protein